jgi:hypothetical protein
MNGWGQTERVGGADGGLVEGDGGGRDGFIIWVR